MFASSFKSDDIYLSMEPLQHFLTNSITTPFTEVSLSLLFIEWNCQFDDPVWQNPETDWNLVQMSQEPGPTLSNQEVWRGQVRVLVPPGVHCCIHSCLMCFLNVPCLILQLEVRFLPHILCRWTGLFEGCEFHAVTNSKQAWRNPRI